jgi:hypothetical protein
MHYHPFLPRRWSSAAFLKWLKRTHAWAGFWGALLFLMLGTSGVLLNHRQQLKIDTGEPVEVSAARLPVAPGTIPDADALGTWGSRTLDLPGKPQLARPDPATANATFAGRRIAPVEIWRQTFALINGRVTLEYVPGANFVTARRDAVGVLATLKNLHKGVGLPVAWVLLIDTIAGALVIMALTGFLLWSKLHGPRLLAGALAGGSLAWALLAGVPALS